MIDTIIIDKKVKIGTSIHEVYDYYQKYIQACSKDMHIIRDETVKYVILRRITREQYERVRYNSLQIIDCEDGYCKFNTLTIDQIIDIKSENIILVDNVDDYTKFKKITLDEFLALHCVNK